MRKIVLLIVVILNFYNLQSQINTYKGNFIDDIGVQIGGAIFEDYETLTISLDGITFLSQNIGVRSGITFLGDVMNSRWSSKIPLYMAIVTRGRTEEYEPNMDTSLLQDILYSLIPSVPTTLELNFGPSIGYVHPKSETKNLTINQKRTLDTYFVHARTSLSLDANIRFALYIKHVGFNINMGASYWITNNFKHYSIKGDEDDGKVSRWMGIMGVGITYQF